MGEARWATLTPDAIPTPDDYAFPVTRLVCQGRAGTALPTESAIIFGMDPVDLLVAQARQELRDGKTAEWRVFARRTRRDQKRRMD